MARTRVVKAGDSWASIAGEEYGNQRWLIELANRNGGVNRMLHPGDVVELPDFDLSTQPVITNDQWGAVPTGVTGGVVNYANVPVPTVTGTKPGAAGANPAATRGKNTAPTFSNGPNYNPLPGGTGSPVSAAPTFGIPGAARQTGGQTRSGVDQFGIPNASRQNGTPRSGTVPNTTPGKPANPMGGTRVGVAGNSTAYPGQRTGAPTIPLPVFGPVQPRFGVAGNSFAPPVRQNNVGDPYSGIPAAARSGGQGNYGQTANSDPASPYNAATPGPVPGPASDRSNIAWAARWVGGGITDYARTGNRNSLPKTISARVAAELPWYDSGYGSAEEYLATLGYQMGPDGNWVRYDPQRRSGYTGQTYAASGGGSGGGGGGYGGFTRGPAAGYGEGLGLTQWRIG